MNQDRREEKGSSATGVEMFKKTLDQAGTGEHGALLRGVQRDEIERDRYFSKPGTIHPHTKFKGQVKGVLKKGRGWKTIHHSSTDTDHVLPENNRRNRRPAAA